jgi:hypothetical protein
LSGFVLKTNPGDGRGFSARLGRKKAGVLGLVLRVVSFGRLVAR